MYRCFHPQAMFEVITSEASYLRSLNTLMSRFINSDELSSGSSLCVLERGQSHVLFSNINSVKSVSESVRHSASYQVNQLVFQSVLINQQVSPTVIQSISQTGIKSVSRSANQLLCLPVCLSLIKSASQSDSKFIQLFGLSVGQSANNSRILQLTFNHRSFF